MTLMKKQLLSITLVALSLTQHAVCMEYFADVSDTESEEELLESTAFIDCPESNALLMSTKEALKLIGNTYAHEPTSKEAPLTEEYVLNDYWQNIAVLNRINVDIANSALNYVFDLFFPDAGYPLWRYHVAAAMLAGANPNIEGRDTKHALSRAALFQDYALCKILLERGANPNVPSYDSPLLFIKKPSLAALFLQYGAKPDFDVLMQTMRHDYEPELISLYKNQGMSPLQTDSLGSTILHYLVSNMAHYHKNVDLLMRKVTELFNGLSILEITALINGRSSYYDGTVLEMLAQKTGPAVIKLETLLRSYVQNLSQN